MTRIRPTILPKPIGLLLDCARQGNVAEAASSGLRAVEVAAAPAAAIGAVGASAVIGWPVYAALAAGLLGVGLWNALDDRKNKARVKEVVEELKKLTQAHGSLPKAAAYMLERERESKRPLELPYSLADNAVVALYETLTARHDDLADTLAKHEGFYVSLGGYLDEHFDDFKQEFQLAQQDRDELRAMLQSLSDAVQNVAVDVKTNLSVSQDSNDTVKRIEQLLLAQRQANPNATPVLSEEDKALLDEAKNHGELKTRAAASVLRPDAETDDLLRQLRDRHEAEAFELDMLEGKRWYFAGEYDKAIDPFERAIGRRRDNVEARSYAAIAHASARLGDLAAHRLRAIEIAEGTIRLVPDRSTDWAMTQNNLGVAWANLPTGDRPSNLRKAIACFEPALEVRTRAAHPVEWATTQNNLGNAWRNLPTDDLAPNLVKAIACYESALEVRTLAAHPVDWAMTQNNLGLAWADLAEQPGQNRCRLLRRAIAAGKGALTIRTPEAFPREHADTLHNLTIDRQSYEAAGCAAEIPFDDIPPAE